MKKSFIAGLVAVVVSGSAVAATAAEYGLLVPLAQYDVSGDVPANRPPPPPVVLVNKGYVEAKLRAHLHGVVAEFNNVQDSLYSYHVDSIAFNDEASVDPLFAGTVVITFLDYTGSDQNLGHYTKKATWTLDFSYLDGVWSITNLVEDVVCDFYNYQSVGACLPGGDL